MTTAIATTPQEVRVTRAATPAWAAVAAWGAGLMEFALGAGAMTDGAGRGAGVILIVLGAASLVWGTMTLVRGRLVVPRTGVAGALTGIGVVVAAFSLDPARTSIAAVGAAVVLLIAVGVAAARQMRRPADAAAPRIAVLMIAAIVVAGLVTPALGATEAGRLAPDHGSHGVVDPGHH